MWPEVCFGFLVVAELKFNPVFFHKDKRTVIHNVFNLVHRTSVVNVQQVYFKANKICGTNTLYTPYMLIPKQSLPTRSKRAEQHL